jgi:hypothetical protein
LVDAVEKVPIFFVTEFPPNNKIRRNRKSVCPQARSFSTSKTSSLAFAGKIARTTSFPCRSSLTTSPAQISPYANFARPMMGARLVTAKFWEEIISGLPIGFRSNCQMFATLRSNFSCVTIAPHENPN